jgi:thiamine pyrophosphate-dependent acetolactate synthase large subunit-like protein
MNGADAVIATLADNDVEACFANPRNARRAGTPIVNLIGDHATCHRQNDAPLASDIQGMAGPNSVWGPVGGQRR